jgi:hypothetical protein
MQHAKVRTPAAKKAALKLNGMDSMHVVLASQCKGRLQGAARVVRCGGGVAAQERMQI